MVGLRPRVVVGTAISAGVIASCQGLFEGSSDVAVLLALLSFLLSRILLDSPVTFLDLTRPDELEPEFDSPAVPEFILELMLEVSIVSPLLGDLPLPEVSSSTHPAGVGGTGPKFEVGPGLRVGGDTTRSVDRDKLCDLDCGGGGPGGGGGSGMPGSHLDDDDPRERDDDGVLVAPAEAALLEAGG